MTAKREIAPGWAFDAARELRCKIHNLENNAECMGKDHPANKAWLDVVSAEDAEVILRHFGRVSR